jgi:hypothetical protein
MRQLVGAFRCSATLRSSALLRYFAPLATSLA